MSKNLGTVLNKIIGAGMLFTAAAFMSPYTSNGPNAVGVAFGLAGLFLVLRKTVNDDSATPEVLQKVEQIQKLVESQHDELEAARQQIAQLIDDRRFMTELAASSVKSESR